MFNTLFSWKLCCIRDNLEKYGWPRKATHDNTKRLKNFACWINEARIQTQIRISNTYGFPWQLWLHEHALMLLWGHPHVIPSPSPIQSHFTSQLSFFCLYTHQHADLVNSSLTKQAKPLSHSLLLCLLPQRKRTSASETTFMKPRPSALSTNKWQSRLTSSDLNKKRPSDQ